MVSGLSPGAFRGFIAPASLKHIIFFNQIQGLSAFRGFIAPASLKRRFVVYFFCGAGAAFRGFIAPASLKQNVHDKRVCTSVCFPGLHCPGLIEARLSNFLGTQLPALSGASLPRPH